MTKVFISYAWENDEHRLWVRDFSIKLRSDGVNISLDQWDLIFGDSITSFMESSIRESDFVLIVCTPTYKEKADKQKGGVAFEESIIAAESLYLGNKRKFIPILRKGAWQDAAPSLLMDKYYVDLSDQQRYEYNYMSLLSVLHKMPITPPPVGSIPIKLLKNTVSLTPDEPMVISLSVDEIMAKLKSATTVAECKICDYNLSKLTNATDVRRIESYLFKGNQRQRNYAALYLRRNGYSEIVLKAYKEGRIDRVQALAH